MKTDLVQFSSVQFLTALVMTGSGRVLADHDFDKAKEQVTRPLPILTSLSPELAPGLL
jgi:hypothetical protein